MAGVAVQADPGDLGLDPGRLARLDAYLQRVVDDGLMPGWQMVVARRGQLVHASTGGSRDIEQSVPVEADTLFRIYSMTKPITSVAAMMLYEQGAFELADPIAKFLPAFAEMRVYAGGSDLAPVTVAASEPIRMVHLLTHTSGLTYDFFRQHPVDALYRAARIGTGNSEFADLAEVCDRLAGLPLLFEPGSEWAYSMATDVLGRVVEVLSGQSLAGFFAEQIFTPLGMLDSAFEMTELDSPRAARLYGWTPAGLRPLDQAEQAVDHPAYFSGGGGLISSAHDYHRFTTMLLRGGELDGARLLSPRTVAFMTRNHIPGGADLDHYGRPLYAESPMRGTGFGLGFSIQLDPAASTQLDSVGSYGWGGAAGTAFWVDPVEQLTAAFYTQVLFSANLPVRTKLRQLVYQALVDRPPAS